MSIEKLRVNGIFFDLDGTIVDSREAYYEAARLAFKAIGQEPPENNVTLEIPRKLEKKQQINNVVKGNLRKFLRVYLKAYRSITMEKTKPLPNVSNTFNIARHFAYVVTALDTDRPKPSPEALTKCAKALDVKMCDCIIVGDSISDVRAGKAAGCKTVAVLSGLFSHQELSKENPDLILEDVTDLPNFIE